MRAELRTDCDDVATPMPRLSWTTESTVDSWIQTGAEIRLDDEKPVHIHGRESVLVPWPFEPLLPRSVHYVRVRVTGADGSTSDWSAPRMILAAFLANGEWAADMITLANPATVAHPALLRTEFEPRGPVRRAILYATARGAYQVRINGTDVDDQIMKPGWTPYRSRLIHESTDVTDLLVAGKNALGVELSGAWYTEQYGHRPVSKPHYGEQPSVAVQLVIDFADGTVQTVVSDSGWRATGNGPSRRSGLYDGEDYDARSEIAGWAQPGFDDTGWSSVVVAADGSPVPSARTSPAVRRIEELPVVNVVDSASGEQILDFGQNLVGRLRIRVHGPAGISVTIRHAEVLENGELGVRPLRFATATDTYILRGDAEETFEPRFTFHGFRFAQISGLPQPINPADVVAIVIHSDMARTGWFESSHALLNRLHENVVWGMRGNFLYLPTDCPQRDERLGWTGDVQVFSPTASYLYNVDGFLSSWLVDLAIEQKASGDGTVPFVVPMGLDNAATPAAAWGDAATVVPMVLYERFGDLGTVEAQYPSMRDWTDKLLDLAGERYLWEGGFQFGDWLDPTAPPNDAHRAKTDPDIVASAYLYRSLEYTAKAALLTDRLDDAAHYGALAERVRRAFIDEYVTPAGRMLSDAQTAYALAITFGFVTGPQRHRMGARLAELVESNGFRIGTGFVGTPLIADALTITGHLDAAGALLLQTKKPSWLYPVTMGATTIWERWDSMLEDGSINPGEMTSFNHYALGAVADWLHRTVAGLGPAEPGYRVLRVAPRPLAHLDFASARLVTPYGLAEVGWKRDGAHVIVTATVPPNTTAEVDLPGALSRVRVGSGQHTWVVTA